MVHFTPLSALSGGIFIGLAALLLLWLQGRIAGISGILAGAMGAAKGDWFWRLLFVVGLLTGGAIGFWLLQLPTPDLSTLSMPLLLVGGFLVGVGAKVGNGCTSGHGICGMGRLSSRSIVATCCFMSTGIMTVFVLRHLLA
jgi:uncharacterized protein